MKSKRICLVATVGVATFALAACGGASAGGADYPAEPVLLTAPANPGSGWDVTARAIADTMTKEGLTDTRLQVQNKPGAVGSVWLSSMVGSHKAADNQIAVTSTPLMTNELRGNSKFGYQDVTMIATLMNEYFIVVVPKDSPYQDLDDLIQDVKTNPSKVPVSAGGDEQLPFALLVQEAKGDPSSVNFIQFDGSGQEIPAITNGEVKAAVAGVTEFAGQLQSGKLRALAVLKDERLSAPYDSIPTSVEQGYDVTLANWRGIYGPPNMPSYAVDYWEDKFAEMVETKTWKDYTSRYKWDTTFLVGKKKTRYLDGVYADLKSALTAVDELEGTS